MTITVEEARNILGAEYDNISDEHIKRMIHQIYTLCSALVDWHIEHPGKYISKKELKEPEPIRNQKRHQVNSMPMRWSLEDKIKRHIEHLAHCKCRPMPEKIKLEIKNRLVWL